MNIRQTDSAKLRFVSVIGSAFCLAFVSAVLYSLVGLCGVVNFDKGVLRTVGLIGWIFGAIVGFMFPKQGAWIAKQFFSGF